jgi:4-hydroxy-2-oxoglutarate aldolase
LSGQTISLCGIFPPIPTPFDASGEINLPALSSNVKQWNQHALAGYVVLGSNGEAPFLNKKEKLTVLETVRQVTPPEKLVIAGTGLESTRATITFTKEAIQTGADAVLIVTPHYFDGKMTDKSLLHHFYAVADTAAVPIILYSVPKFTHVDLNAETIAQASHHPNIIGIKDSGGNIAKIADIVRLTSPEFQVLAGSASFLFAALTLGAVGGVLALANIAPEACISIHQLTQTGDWNAAAELQRQMNPVNASITSKFGIAGLKYALDVLGYYGGPVRPPLLPLVEQEQAALKEILTKSGLID